ncbi:hypothetical protein SDRG_04029 [Saprolegnia diclina VS20]|uniref:Protein YIPF n=1 Tax=Saprolegnia diclina (strain VS20) TaxID=1156394 RepID=T0QJU3_SAPDV|nr:hypothetical protein SDRG_04029 [Saprolegnia diclina VS20]EQC38309.1 hypothetical protein SDRG_04029 [Saprolegnia diclina VS20]|eukprot:XP_008607901.1 hypothetical protein SDRG_04029 [Saprolegnia diclina VS20]
MHTQQPGFGQPQYGYGNSQSQYDNSQSQYGNSNQGSYEQQGSYGQQGGYGQQYNQDYSQPGYPQQPAYNQPTYHQPPPQNQGGNAPWFTGGDSAPTSDLTGSMGRMGDGPPPSGRYGSRDDEDYENEPPLLEELGVNFGHIWMKTQSVLLPTKEITEHILDDTDLAGPLVFCFVFGTCLLLSGKIHFGYIYGFGVFGWVFMWAIMNLLSPTRTIDIYRVCSVLGYCLLPIILLAAVNIVVSVKSLNYIGLALAFLSVAWSTQTATRFFEKALHMHDQRFLIAYPTAMVYSCFVLITVF